MRFLVLSRFRPDLPMGGAAIRNCQTIRALARIGTVDVVTVGDDLFVSGEVDGVEDWTAFSLRELLDGMSAWERRKGRLWRLRPGAYPKIDMYFHRRVAEFLEKRVKERGYEAAVVEEVSLARYLPVLSKAGCRVVFDAHNVESVLRSDLEKVSSGTAGGNPVTRYLLESRMASIEKEAILRSDHVWVCSQVDADQIGEVYGRRKGVAVVPNGVNLDNYPRGREETHGDEWEEPTVRLVFPGSYSYFPNEEAALTLIQDIVPAIRERGRKVHLTLIGRDPTEKMRMAAADDESIEITGAVEDVVPFLEKPGIVMVPLSLGSGTRLKILEAFAAGRPVVSTKKGAEGIAGVDGKHLIIRESAEEMAAAACQLWDDAPMREAMRKEALGLVGDDYSWVSAAGKVRKSLKIAGGNGGNGASGEDGRVVDQVATV